MSIENIIESDRESLGNKADIIIINGEIFTYKNTGLTRRVFVNKDKTKVVKILVSDDRFHFNTEEAEIWNKATEERRKEFAKTELLETGEIVQEFLYTLDDPATMKWLGRALTMKEIRFAASCRNDVGFDKDGNLKCFDLHEYKKY